MGYKEWEMEILDKEYRFLPKITLILHNLNHSIELIEEIIHESSMDRKKLFENFNILGDLQLHIYILINNHAEHEMSFAGAYLENAIKSYKISQENYYMIPKNEQLELTYSTIMPNHLLFFRKFFKNLGEYNFFKPSSKLKVLESYSQT